MRLIFERLRDKVSRRNDEDRHSQRRTIDGLRSRIKHLEPAVGLSDTWEQVRPRLEKFEEFQALDSDDLRKQAFDKHMKRLKERDEEHDRRPEKGDKDRERDRDRDSHRERDREHGRDSHRRHRTRTRTPEVDAYEADRRKAQADRERQYRKTSASASGLTPPPRRDRDRERDRERDRDRNRDDRYDRYDGRSRGGSSSHYDRERREREAEREKNYHSRADPRERASELDYGDSKPSSVRRRRDSDASGRDSKVRESPTIGPFHILTSPTASQAGRFVARAYFLQVSPKLQAVQVAAAGKRGGCWLQIWE
jgi:pre-mRNA-processing factor 40